MKNWFSKRTILTIAAALMLLIGGFSFPLLFSASETALPAKVQEFSGETVCMFPAVLEKPPWTFGLISWRYTVRAKYRFATDNNGYRYFSSEGPPPTSAVMMPIGAPAGVDVSFESAESVLEPFVLNICFRPFSKKWKFTFPDQLPTTQLR